MKGKHAKDMKVSELATMVAREFTDLRKDFSDEFGRVHTRIDMVEHKVDRIQDSVNELNFEGRKMRTRVENLEIKIFGSIQEP